jgi:hypothetical protein
MNSLPSKLRNSLFGFAAVVILNGCAQDYSMVPLAGGEKLKIGIKMPEGLEAKPLRVMYRSAICQRASHDSNGKPQMLSGYKGYETSFKQRGATNLYEAELFINGGGRCEWQLSNIIFGVKYRIPSRFGSNVTNGTGGTVIVRLDDNVAQFSTGWESTVAGVGLKIVEDYYPWVSEKFIDGYAKRAGLSSEGGGYISYKAPQAREIYFEPLLHSRYVVTSISPMKHVIGDFMRFHYPDGTTESDGKSKPNFEKLQEIRLKAEVKK